MSKDDILAFLNHRGGAFIVLGVAGYVGALLTGIYTFRMIFRAFFGQPCAEARQLEHGHLAHAEVPRNPTTGEPEDTDVGFPGPGHYIGEREPPMKIAMGALAVLTVIGGVLQIPGVDDALTRFLSPTFADSRLARLQPATAPAWLGLAIGATIAICGIAIAYRVWVTAPGTATVLRGRFAEAHRFLVNKWYFDELIDWAVVRPAQWAGRFIDAVLERRLISGATVGGTVGTVRTAEAVVHRWQSGFLRYYAAAMLLGTCAVALYFLLSSSY